MARHIFSQYSRGSSRGFLSIGSSRVNDFGGYAQFGLRDLRSDEEKIGLGLALLEKAGQSSDLAWSNPVIYCDFPKPGDTDEYAICIGFELTPCAGKQGEW